MSFSSEVKEELSKLSNLANKDAVKWEFIGYLTTNHITQEQNKIKFSTENEYNINRFSKLLNNLNCTNYEIKITGKNFSIIVPVAEIKEVSHIDEKLILNENEIVQKAFIRGAFLGSGSMTNPKNSYHLEILFANLKDAKISLKILENYNINLKTITKNQSYGIYAKDGEEISKFLAFIGANNAVLKFEEIRVYRDIRNNVNRKVNCETANLNRTVNSAVKQIEAIKLLEKSGKLAELSEGIQEIAKLRIFHPEASLAELGAMLAKPIGKSGVNHRLKTIEKLAMNIKE